MVERELEIINKLGLHARAAARLVSVASAYPCQVHIERNGRSVNAKSIMGVMMLAAGRGSRVTLRAEGDQEDAALQAVVDLINDRFGEDE